MPFPSKLLNDNEQVILDLRPHWWYMAKSTAALLAAIIVGVLVWEQDLPEAVNLFIAALIVFCLGWFGVRYMKWVSTNFVVTTDRVIHRFGVLSKHGVEIPLERINTVFFHQSFFERMLGQGDLGIESAGERGTERFENVRKPALVQNEIYRQMEANATRIHGARSYQASTQPGPDTSIPAQLSQLDDLRKRGVITEAEFAAKKAELLNRM